MRESKIQYNPSLSVKDNAKKNGVTEAAIRYYIKTNALDRRYDRKINIIDDCRKYLKKHPNTTRDEISKKTGYSLSTIRKYWTYIADEKELTDFDRNKAQKRQLRQGNNYYATHPSVTQDLLTVELFNDKILEPFCGGGSMAEVIKTNGYEVDAFDIIDRGYGKQGDFFELDFPIGEYDIISNPPYDTSLIRIIERCLSICKNKVAMLLPLIYLSGKARYEEVYKKFPPVRVYVYSERIGIAKNGDFKQYSYSGANKTIYAWFIWEKGYKGKTELKWLSNEKGAEHLIAANIALKNKVKLMIQTEHQNTINIENTHLQIPYPKKTDLYKSEPEQYDASRFLCYAFRRKEDLHKGTYIPLGNMNGGFPFEINGVTFFTSESAYICGSFSDDTEEHLAVQRALIAETNGYVAKKQIRARYQGIVRKDWREFNVEWMMFVIWKKVQGNREFRDILLSIPQEAIIIENTSFQPIKDPDTSVFWGCRNSEHKDFGSTIKRYAQQLFQDDDVKRDNYVSEKLNDYCNSGIFIGHNVMGKILMLIKKCLHEGTEPDIDYDLLKSRNIHLLGRIVMFSGSNY